jgi:predicted nucleic acid-binding protein
VKIETSVPKVFIDADVLFAGAVSPSEYGASLMILRLAEITLIQAITSEQVITEVQRNMNRKFPQALSTLMYLIDRCVDIKASPQKIELKEFVGLADAKDLPILVAALRENCNWLVTFNIRHFKPGHPDISVLTPGDFLLKIRHQLSRL